MLMRFDPWRELDRITEEVWGGLRRRGLPIDAYRKGDEFVVTFDLPGVDSDSIDLTVTNNVLTVKAERHFEPEDGVEVLASERPVGKFVRQIFLGDALDTDNLKATYENGVLTVVVPVAESAKPKKIEIGAGEPAKAIESGSQAA
jgi:HSP20 family protein